MFKRMLVLTLLGVLIVGGAVAWLGAPTGAGPLTALAALAGGDDHDREHGEHDDDD